MDYTSVIVLAVILGCIPGAIAQSKGRPFVAWWLFGTALFVVALPMSIAAKPIAAGARGPQPTTPAGGDRTPPVPSATRECPACKEAIRRDASVCPHCRRESAPWAYRDGVWWTQDPQSGGDVWLDETDGSWKSERPEVVAAKRHNHPCAQCGGWMTPIDEWTNPGWRCSSCGLVTRAG